MNWTLIKKELRGSWPLGVFMFLAGLMSAIYIIRSQDTSNWNWGRIPLPLLSENFIALLSWVSALGGIALGVWLTLREDVGKTWPFLIHRTTTRGAILSSKLICAAILYFGALLPPFALIAVVSATPGNFPAPWSILFIFPGLGIILGGFALLLATMLCCLRRAKWYGSRFLPLALAVGFFFLCNNLIFWPLTFSIWIGLILLLLCAIWQVFTERPKFGRGALALLLSGGILVVGGLMVCLITGLFEILYQNTIFPEKYSEYNSVNFSRQGEPLICTRSINPETYEFKNLDGTVVQTAMTPEEYQKGIREMAGFFPYYGKKNNAATLRCDAGIELLESYNSNQKQYYHYLLPSKLAIAYDADSKQFIGYWSKNGFTTRFEDATPIEAVYRDSKLYLQTLGDLYLLDQDTNKTTHFISGYASGVDISESNYDSTDKFKVLYCLVDDRIETRDLISGKNASFVLPARAKSFSNYPYVVQLGDNTLGIVNGRSYSDDLRPEEPNTYVAKVSSTGELLFERELQLNLSPRSQPDTSPYWLVGIVFAGNPMVLGTGLLVHLCDTALRFPFLLSNTDYIPKEFKKTLPVAFIVLLVSLILCAVAAMMMLRRREPNLKKRLAWAVFAVLTGFSGLFVIWILCLSEKRVTCPNCGKKRWPTQDNCPFCQATWPIPPQRDIDLITQI